MAEGEAAVVAKALADYENKLGQGETLKLIDYIRLLEGRRKRIVEVPAKITLRWADKWQSTTANEQ